MSKRFRFDQADLRVSELMQRARYVQRAWQTIKLISDPMYARTEAEDGPRWVAAAAVLEAQDIEVPNSALLVWR